MKCLRQSHTPGGRQQGAAYTLADLAEGLGSLRIESERGGFGHGKVAHQPYASSKACNAAASMVSWWHRLQCSAMKRLLRRLLGPLSAWEFTCAIVIAASFAAKVHSST